MSDIYYNMLAFNAALLRIFNASLSHAATERPEAEVLEGMDTDSVPIAKEVSATPIYVRTWIRFRKGEMG